MGIVSQENALAVAETLDTKAQATATPEKELRRWLMEIKLAEKREKDFRKEGRAILERYRGKAKSKNSFNILWSNTEVLRPALYNSQPKPDVRRRFRQNDSLGKAVAEVAERSISYCVDAYDLDACLKNDVLDALLPGRGISRVRYIPMIKQVGVDPTDPAEAFQGTHEEVEYEQALCDHVQWDDFLHGPGKVWAEVMWVGFKHRMTRDDLVEKFGKEIGNEITLDDVADDDLNERSNDDVKDAFKRAELWEIWDKDGEQVFFVSTTYRKGVIYSEGTKGEPPQKFKNFFPCPQPLMMVEDTGTLVPLALYELYRKQAEELDLISSRINKIVNACRVRFVHDPALSELKSLMDAGDNEGIPAENARMWLTNGGIEKAIWWMPVEQIAKVLKELYVARESAKQVIYEITGISDILRGATDPNETLGAQKLKANSSSLRMQRMQREVQRYVRDLIRLLAEIIGEHFSADTLAKMTGLNFPTNEQKQQMQVMAQPVQAAIQAGQQPPPEIQQKLQQAQQMLQMPSWEDIMGVLKSDMQREYRVDVETDSTVAESLTQDMEGMREVYTGLIELWQGAGPAVASGAVKIDVVKALSLNLARRARMGLEVEDALETGMQEPKPQTDPKAQADAQKQQQDAMQAQHDAQLEQQKQQSEQALAQREQAHEEMIAQRDQALEQQKAALEQQQVLAEQRLEEQRIASEARIAAIESADKYEFERWKVEQELASKERIAKTAADASQENAKTSAQASKETAQIGADAKAEASIGDTPKPKKPLDQVKELHATLQKRLQDLDADAAEPIRIDRGPDGKLSKITKGKRSLRVVRDSNGITLQ